MKKQLCFLFVCMLWMCNAKSQNSPGFEQDVYKSFNMYSRITGYNGSYSAREENTKGSRYLFYNWVHGNVTTTQGNVIQNDSFLYNFNKMTDELLVTGLDKKNIISIDKNSIASFTLFNGDSSYTFEHANAINPNLFFILLVKNANKYSLYKYYKTTFQQANYSTNGIVESGNSYNEFIDNIQYFILMPNNQGYKLIDNLKPKSIKAALSNESVKVNEYYKQHSGEPLVEAFLINLINYLNQ